MGLREVLRQLVSVDLLGSATSKLLCPALHSKSMPESPLPQVGFRTFV